MSQPSHPELGRMPEIPASTAPKPPLVPDPPGGVTAFLARVKKRTAAVHAWRRAENPALYALWGAGA